jgi:ATP-dependent DNA helicase RecG
MLVCTSPNITMLSEDQLLALLSEFESDQVERTESVTNTDTFGQAICAFANDLPSHGRAGYLLVGVRDNGALAGLHVTDQLLTNLASIRSDGNILPQPVMHVTKFSFAAGDIAVVEVHPSDLPPVRYKGTVYIRVGPRKAVANEQEERLLTERRIAFAKSFDAQPCTQSKIEDLALSQFEHYRREAVDSETIAANHRNTEQQLASLRLYDSDRHCATHAGLLLVGKNPRFYLPGAYVQYLELPGTSLTEIPTDQAEVAGDLHTLVKELEGRVRLLVKTSMVTLSALQEKQIPNYPEAAIRELLMNAVMHRNYNSNSPIRFYAFARNPKSWWPLWRSHPTELSYPQQLP